MDLIQITNTGDEPFTLPHDGSGHVTIEPGKTRTLQADYATIFFGHPGTRNDTRERARETTHKQTLTLWGVYPGITTEEEAAELLPSFECRDMDGNRVWMVLDDPEGTQGSESTLLDTDEANAATLQQRLDEMQAQVQQLLAAQKQQATGSAHAEAPDGDGLGKAGEDEAGEGQGTGGQTQAERNEQREDIPKAPATSTAKKDGPRTSRVGGR